MRCDSIQDLIEQGFASLSIVVIGRACDAIDDCHKLITISEIRFTCVLVVANAVLYIMLMYMVTVSRWRKFFFFPVSQWRKNFF